LIRALQLLAIAAITLSHLGCATTTKNKLQTHLNDSEPGPTYVTKNGLEIYDETGKEIPRWKIEKLVQIALSVLTDYEALRGWKIRIVPSYIIVTQGDNLIVAEGFTHPKSKTVLVSNVFTCFADSALVHELAHIVLGAPHTETEFWRTFKIFDKSIGDYLCPQWIDDKESLADWRMVRENKKTFKHRIEAVPTISQLNKFLNKIKSQEAQEAGKDAAKP